MALNGKISPPPLVFYTRRDPSGAEFVLLAGEDTPETGPLPRAPEDRTQYEAVLNHCHLFPGPLRPRKLAEARRAGLAAARSLRDSLARAFPGKRFAVFLTVSPEDVILRFHQLWPGSPLTTKSGARWSGTRTTPTRTSTPFTRIARSNALPAGECAASAGRKKQRGNRRFPRCSLVFQMKSSRWART